MQYLTIIYLINIVIIMSQLIWTVIDFFIFENCKNHPNSSKLSSFSVLSDLNDSSNERNFLLTIINMLTSIYLWLHRDLILNLLVLIMLSFVSPVASISITFLNAFLTIQQMRSIFNNQFMNVNLTNM